MPDTVTPAAPTPLVIEPDVAAAENAEFLKAQVAFLQNRVFVMAQLLKNKDAQLAALATSGTASADKAPTKPRV